MARVAHEAGPVSITSNPFVIIWPVFKLLASIPFFLLGLSQGCLFIYIHTHIHKHTHRHTHTHVYGHVPLNDGDTF